MLTKEKLTEYLREKYNPVAIVLHGSRANGNAREHSDWDVMIFTETKVDAYREIYDGANIEIKQVLLPIADDQIWNRLGFPFRTENTEILYDAKSIVPDLLQKNEVVIAKGNIFTEHDKIARHAFLSSALDGMLDYQNEPLVVFDKKHDFYDRAVAAWFGVLHSEFKPSDYIALPRIKHDDPTFYDLLEKFVVGDVAQALTHGRQILSHLFPNI